MRAWHNGGIYAIRRKLFQPIPPNTIVDDFVIPLLAKLRSGCGIVYDADAIAHEETAADVPDRIPPSHTDRCGGLAGNRDFMAVVKPSARLDCIHLFLP